jgi:hypothetical protein
VRTVGLTGSEKIFLPHGVSAFSETMGFVTLKSESGTSTSYEFEYEIPTNKAIEIISRSRIE